MTLMTLWGYVEIFMAHRESSGTGKKAWGGWFQFLSHQDGACFQAHRSPWSTFCRNPFVKMEHLSFFRVCFYCFQWIGCERMCNMWRIEANCISACHPKVVTDGPIDGSVVLLPRVTETEFKAQAHHSGTRCMAIWQYAMNNIQLT